MTEHKVWTVFDEQSVPGAFFVFQADPRSRYESPRFRCVEATLTIPDEPEWTVITHDDGSVEVLRGSIRRSGRDPDFYDQSFDVRAPDAVTALQRAMEQRND